MPQVMPQTNTKPQEPVDPFAAMLDSHFEIKSSKDILDELAKPAEPVEVEEPEGL